MADYGIVFELILAALTFVIVGLFFIVYLMIIGEREKKKLRVKAGSTAQEEGPEGCVHYFGYLAGYPLNQPVPEECFGCVKAIECMNEKATENITENTTKMAETQPQQ